MAGQISASVLKGFAMQLLIETYARHGMGETEKIPNNFSQLVERLEQLHKQAEGLAMKGGVA